MIRSAVVDREIDIASIVAEARSPGAGAVSLFIGTVRETSDGRQVTGLEYEAYQAMADTELAGILHEAAREFGVSALIAEHRIGTLNVGDVSVVIASAHAHRAAAMDCTRFVIDEIKKRVPIWKREHFVDGTREWVDPSRVGVSAS
ncbi:MAG TPA: molybdenum cofactor biosynthesis protein MoaE [Gemmatimonadaceae bacterium]|nr:molybdenum cofactor biosynthesis protein MoaE [Gemmatimonadaceae bacterium]